MNAFVCGFFGTLGAALALFTAAQFLDMAIPRDDSDPMFGRSGMNVLTDYKTQLQYLKSGAAITPRMDANGKQMRADQ